MQVMILGSRRLGGFTDGGRELFDAAAQGRIDAFFLSGGQIDGEGTLNLVGLGDYPDLRYRFPGSFGSAYLYPLIPNVLLFREEHSRRVLVPKVDFASARGTPTALVTSRCVFQFQPERRRFLLVTTHPGQTLATIMEHTGFEFDTASPLTETRAPGPRELDLLGGKIADELADVYPRFAQTLASGCP
jgi:glutaconate CoA-transferase subunit B